MLCLILQKVTTEYRLDGKKDIQHNMYVLIYLSIERAEIGASSRHGCWDDAHRRNA